MRVSWLAVSLSLGSFGSICMAACSKEPPAPAPAVSSSPAASVSATASASPLPSEGAKDNFATSKGDLRVVPIHHGSLAFEFRGKVIYVDPADADFSGRPKADYIFVTDIHPDHQDPKVIELLKKEGTVLVGPPAVGEKTPLTVTLKNGETKDFELFSVATVPMYNLKRGPAPGKLFHDKGRGDGYIFTFGEKRVYVSGDTECTPEMRALKDIDVAFVCMNLPYTMTPAEAAECVNAFKPKVVYPYHYRESKLSEFEAPVRAGGSSEIRLRTWY
ncbi:MBL fold metallo-hydrolase [Pendulispora brunnea]|uniref:MBL fold metallo-hydrolase n=1 Tax=Pendulispora brunnea TaxID=2905690 RepID=A0ABZ2KFE3_9BACT